MSPTTHTSTGPTGWNCWTSAPGQGEQKSDMVSDLAESEETALTGEPLWIAT